ncbi:MAG: signal peptidase II [Opitutaceae bacterium]|jgi:signal peptidase II|nr:signal peptidase II [Cephaloticoccus sp.]MCP5530838.1 signal peptidase II [Opitutaceae bacterium]
MQAGQPTPTTAAPASRWQRILSYRLLLVLAVVIFGLDQVTKLWIIERMPLGSYGPGESITVIPGFFYLVHVGNTGAAWSMLTGKSTLLAFIAIITLAGIYFFRSTLGLRDRLAQIAFGLLCGGIVGNLVDRIQHQHVVDFLDFHFGSYVYPTFNVADSAICVGVVLYLWHSFKTQPAAVAEKS